MAWLMGGLGQTDSVPFPLLEWHNHGIIPHTSSQSASLECLQLLRQTHLAHLSAGPAQCLGAAGHQTLQQQAQPKL